MKKLLFVDNVDPGNTKDFQIPKNKLLFAYFQSYDSRTKNCDFIGPSRWVCELFREYPMFDFSRTVGDEHRLMWDYNNRHHYDPIFLYEHIGKPMLKELGIISVNDEFKIKTIDPIHNFKILVPVHKSYDLFIYFGNQMIHTDNWATIYGYDNLLYNERKAYYKDSIYHKMICFPHACSGYVNACAQSNKRILISGDSHTIPLIPIFVHYFKEVVYLDNRGKWGPEKLLENFGRFDNYIFMLSDCHTKNHFFKKNFGLK